MLPLDAGLNTPRRYHDFIGVYEPDILGTPAAARPECLPSLPSSLNLCIRRRLDRLVFVRLTNEDEPSITSRNCRWGLPRPAPRGSPWCNRRPCTHLGGSLGGTRTLRVHRSGSPAPRHGDRGVSRRPGWSRSGLLVRGQVAGRSRQGPPGLTQVARICDIQFIRVTTVQLPDLRAFSGQHARPPATPGMQRTRAPIRPRCPMCPLASPG